MKKNLLTSFTVKHLFKTFVLLILIQSNSINSQSWQWAKDFGGAANDVGQSTCTDAMGNVFVAGYFNSTSINVGTVVVNNSGATYSDAFVAKYDQYGNFQWVQRIGGSSGAESISGLCCDPAGRVYVYGEYSSSLLSLPPFTWGNPGPGYYNLFLACIDGAGVPQWLNGYGGAGSEFASGCAYSSALSSVYFIGTYYDPTLTIGTTTLNNSTVAGGKAETFFAKVSNTGAFQWARSTGAATSNDFGNSIAVDPAGNPCITGTFDGPVVTATTVIGTTTLTSYGNQDIYLAKYNSAGSFQWARNVGSSSGGDYAAGIAVDASSNIYFDGYYGGNMTVGTTTLAYSGYYDAFVAKYNSAGTVLWSNRISGTDAEYLYDITLDGNANAYVAGTYAGTVVTAGTYTIANTVPGPNTNVFVAKYNSSGVVQWLTNASGAGNEWSFGISADAVGNVYSTGYIDGATSFGTTTLTIGGGYDIYFAKIGCLTTSVTGTGTNVCTGSSATITASGASTYTWSTGTSSGSSIVITPTVNAVISVSATAGGCVGTPASYTLNILPASLSTTSTLSLLCKQKAQITTTCSPTATSVSWSPSANLSSSTALSPTVTAGAGLMTYVVTATLNNGCVVNGNSTISSYAQTPNICIVTVDSLGYNNEIYWEKTLYPQADSFIVYRETSLNTYKRIGGVKYSSFSMYTDTNRSIGPANGNPNLTYYKYKLQIKDSCGNTSPMSLWHETIFIQDQLNGNFNWNSYAIELSSPPISNYNLKRRDMTTGTETVVVSTVGNLATDPQYNTFWPITTIRWFVDAIGFSCAPSIIGPPKNNNNTIMLTKTKTKSNQSNDKIATGINGYDLSNVIKVYPNPANDHINVDLNGLDKTETTVEIKNMLGQLVYQTKALNQYLNITTESISGGVYTVNIIQNSRTIATKKVVVEK
jgi:hypothetical protein